MLSLQDKIVIVTGATGNIGKKLVTSFAGHGARVIACSRTRDKLDIFKHGLSAWDGHIECAELDISKKTSIENFTGFVENMYGRADVLINNASVIKDSSFENISEQEWNTVIGTNLKGTFALCAATVSLMRKADKGSIINIASQAATTGLPLVGLHYSASKGGIVSLTRGLAKEVGRFNIRVNTILPGFIASERTKKVLKDDNLYKRLIEKTALKRAGSIEEVVNVCLFLASPLSSYITGEPIAVNGGFVSQLVI